jgi:hypothetical protein
MTISRTRKSLLILMDTLEDSLKSLEDLEIRLIVRSAILDLEKCSSALAVVYRMDKEAYGAE